MWPTSNTGQLESKDNQTGAIVNRKLDFKWVMIGDQSKFCLTKQITERYLFVYFLLLRRNYENRKSSCLNRIDTSSQTPLMSSKNKYSVAKWTSDNTYFRRISHIPAEVTHGWHVLNCNILQSKHNKTFKTTQKVKEDIQVTNLPNGKLRIRKNRNKPLIFFLALQNKVKLFSSTARTQHWCVCNCVLFHFKNLPTWRA